MKSLSQKRQEAYLREKQYTYENSKAKRKGIAEQEWVRATNAHILYLHNVYRCEP